MYQGAPRHPNFAFQARRAAKKQDDELARVGEEFQKLRRFGAPLKPAEPPAPPAPVKPVLPPPPVPAGLKKRSELRLPHFPLPPQPMPAPPPQPVLRARGPAPLRQVHVSNVAMLAMALEQARPGDAIVLADGEYVMPNKRFSLRGTAEHPVTIVAGGPAVILGGGQSPHTLQLDRCEHLIVNGLRFACRGPQTARAINVTDGNHVTIAGCWVGEGAPGKDLACIHFGSDASGRYNHHNRVLGNVVYASGSPAIQFGPGGGTGAQVLDNELRARGPEGKFAALLSFTPGGTSAYRQVTVRGNQLRSEGGTGAGIVLGGVAAADVSGNAIHLKRDPGGHGGALLEVPNGAGVSGLLVHHNAWSYDRGPSATAGAPFVFNAPVQATFAENAADALGERLTDGRCAGMASPAAGLVQLV